MNVNKKPQAPETRPMTAAVFVREFAARQRQLLDALRDQIERGEVQLESGAKADRHVERVVSAWCEDAQPDTDAHLRMVGAVFLIALYDELYAADTQDEDTDEEPERATAADVAVEVLRTIQSIWGIK